TTAMTMGWARRATDGTALSCVFAMAAAELVVTLPARAGARAMPLHLRGRGSALTRLEPRASMQSTISFRTTAGTACCFAWQLAAARSQSMREQACESAQQRT